MSAFHSRSKNPGMRFGQSGASNGFDDAPDALAMWTRLGVKHPTAAALRAHVFTRTRSSGVRFIARSPLARPGIQNVARGSRQFAFYGFTGSSAGALSIGFGLAMGLISLLLLASRAGGLLSTTLKRRA